MYAAIGYGGHSPRQKAVGRMRDELRRIAKPHREQGRRGPRGADRPAKSPAVPKPEHGIIVEGLDNCLVKFSNCCMPVPGDEIVGFITRGYGVSVHRTDCPNASQERRSAPGQEGRWIRVSWGTDIDESYPTTLEVVCKDRPKLMLDISAALSATDTRVSSLNLRTSQDQFAIFHLEIGVRDGKQLRDVMNKLNQISGVLNVTRPAG
jgi:GTP pyrophosphokinase